VLKKEVVKGLVWIKVQIWQKKISKFDNILKETK
jgi:hypothetical protein